MKVTSWSSEEKEVQNGVIRGQWKAKGVHHYNEDDYLISVDVTSESNHRSGWKVSSSTDFCEWENGNLVKAGKREDAKCVASMTYGDVDNTANLDLNFLLANTEWLDCLAFEERGVKFFGYIGKRSAKLMTKEIDYSNNFYKTYDYTLNSDGTVATIKMVGYLDDGTVEFRQSYTLTYTLLQTFRVLTSTKRSFLYTFKLAVFNVPFIIILAKPHTPLHQPINYLKTKYLQWVYANVLRITRISPRITYTSLLFSSA